MQQQRSVYVYQHWPPCQICGAAVSKLQSGLATAEAHTTKKSFLPRDSSGRGQEEDRQGRDRDGRVRPRREERKGRQGV